MCRNIGCIFLHATKLIDFEESEVCTNTLLSKEYWKAIFNYDKNGTLHVADGLQRSTNGEYFEATSINTNKGLPFPMKSNKKTPNGLIYMRQ